MKKWSYAAAMMLTLATGSIFTGCIDNDEPYGIQEVRLATAKLLEAKAAAADADKAAQEAAVQMAQIQAEIDKIYAQAELVRANSEAECAKIYAEAAAAVSEAQAAKLNAQADSIKTAAQAELEKAQAEIQLKRDIVDKKLELADQKLAELKYELELKKLQDADARNSDIYAALEGAYENYISALDDYNKQLKKIAKAQLELDEAKVDLAWVWNSGVDEQGNPIDASQGGKWVSPNYENKEYFENEIAGYNSDIELAQKKIEIYNEAIDQVKNVQASDLYALLESYTEAQKEHELKLAELEVQKDEIRFSAEAQNILNQIESDKAAVATRYAKSITIPAVTYTAPAGAQGIFFGGSTVNVVSKTTYTLEDYYADTKNNAYTNAVNAIKAEISRLQQYIMDENDKAWTDAQVNELTNELNALTSSSSTYSKDKALWEKAVAYYNKGNGPKDATETVPNDDALEAAIVAYNNGIPTLQAAFKTLTDAETARDNALKAYNDSVTKYAPNDGDQTAAYITFKNAQAAYDKAIKDATDVLEAARSAADEAYESTISAIEANVADLQEAYEKAEADLAYAQALQGLYPTIYNGTYTAPYYTLRNNALTALTKAQAEESTEKTKAQSAKTLAYKDAQAQYDLAKSYADAEFDRAAFNYAQALKADDQTIYAPIQEALDAYNAAVTKVNAVVKDLKANAVPAFQALYADLVKQYNTQVKAMACGSWSDWTVNTTEVSSLVGSQSYKVDAFYDLLNSDASNGKKVYANLSKLSTETPAYYSVNGVYTNVKNYLIACSQATYGNLGNTKLNTDSDGNLTYTYVYNGAYEDVIDEAFLVEPTDEMIYNYILKMYQIYEDGTAVSVPPTSIPNYFVYFGAYGEVLSVRNQLAIAEYVATHEDANAELVAPLQTALSDIQSTFTTANNEYNTLKNALTASENAYDALYTDVENEIDAEEELTKPYQLIVKDLNTAVNVLAGNDGVTIPDDADPTDMQAALASAIESWQEKISTEETKLASAQAALKKAQYQLEQLEAQQEIAAAATLLQIKIDYLTETADALQELVDFYKSRVEDLTKEYEAAIG